MKNTHLLFILMFLCFISCKNDKKGTAPTGTSTQIESADASKLLLGRWETHTTIEEDQFKEAMDGDIEEGMSGRMIIQQEYHFIKGNRYNGEAEITFILMMENQAPLPLHFYAKESGTWNLHDDTLVTVSEDSKITAMDEITKSVLDNVPEFKEMIQPNKGEATSFNIKTVTESVLKMADESFSKLTFTYNKKI